MTTSQSQDIVNPIIVVERPRHGNGSSRKRRHYTELKQRITALERELVLLRRSMRKTRKKAR